MLVQFSVSNYKSFKEPQILSLVAAKDSSLPNNVMKSGISAAPQLLRSCVLYGPNAGGKTNLILALAFMKAMVQTSAGIQEGQTLNTIPFKFDSESLENPSEFEITCIVDKVRYQYGFALNSKRIIREWLFAFIGSKGQTWFEREYDSAKNEDKWYIGSNLLGGRQRQLWKKSTRSNALFLSTAVNLNSEQLRPLFDWFAESLVILPTNIPLSLLPTIEMLKNSKEKSSILKFMQAADLGITDIKVEMQKAHTVGIRFEPAKIIEQSIYESEFPVITLFHKKPESSNMVGFNYETEESQGTQRLFAYAGSFLDVLKKGKILLADELDNSLHPKIVRFLVSLWNNPEVNENDSQLIFSTHDTSLLDNSLFRRDQVWFVEKDSDQASKLYPLTDYSPRKDEALERGYLMGRYGAIPFFTEFKF